MVLRRVIILQERLGRPHSFAPLIPLKELFIQLADYV